ncbi:MAG: class I mannose-6-phosphate isomerase [Clostridia bacterium]|nr:class I mannose-6-phosphate isomerase [Clostridia bacterium]
MIYPIKTVPVFKQYIWGGNTLETKFGKNIPDGFAAESWEISCHSDGLCTVANGEHKGKTLREVVFSNPAQMLGKDNADEFPLLVKLLDAKDKLSVQVHPDNEFAAKHENGELGKTEMWYVVDAKPGAVLVYGLKEGANEKMLEEAINNGTLEELLNYVPVKKGDSFFIPAGTIHAICDGLLIAEIQQSSNTTYRVYDYNRIDKDGNKRPLHTQKAVQATKYDFSHSCSDAGKTEMIDGGTMKILAQCEYFSVIKYDVETEIEIQKPTSKFEMLVCTEGKAVIKYDDGEEIITGGDSFFIPAAMKNYRICGLAEILRSFE